MTYTNLYHLAMFLEIDPGALDQIRANHPIEDYNDPVRSLTFDEIYRLVCVARFTYDILGEQFRSGHDITLITQEDFHPLRGPLEGEQSVSQRSAKKSKKKKHKKKKDSNRSRPLPFQNLSPGIAPSAMGTQRSLTGMPIINLRNKLTCSVTPTPGLHGLPTINEGEVFHDPHLSITNSYNSDSSSSSSSSYVHLTDDNDSDSSDDGLDARNFRKGVKRDISMYSNFKDDKQWYAWYRDTLATARVHGTHQVFDPSYYPKTRKESALWQEIQQFMYSVFCRVLQTASGRMMVKRHEERADAQGIATALCEHYEHSIIAQTNVQDVRAGLAQLRIKDWKSSKQAFLNNW